MRLSRARLPGRAALIVAVSATLLAQGCVTQESQGTREYLDEHTAATVTVASKNLVFARSRPEYAVNARDYLTIVPVDVNRTGKHSLYLFCYAWTTVDKRGATETLGDFQLMADGRQISLAPAATRPHDLGFGELPINAPAHAYATIVVPTTRETLQYLNRAQALFALRTRDGLSERFDVWEDGREALGELLHGGSGTR
jgi:hypothetical protein